MQTVPQPQTPGTHRHQADPKLLPGRNFCKCAACGEYFSTVRAFDSHRIGKHKVPGDRRCLTFAGMKSKGLRLNSKGYWTRAYLPDAEVRIEQKSVA